MKKEIITIKIDPARRKMSAEELRVYLRESRRGCGIHGVVDNKTKRRKEKHKIKNVFADQKDWSVLYLKNRVFTN